MAVFEIFSAATPPTGRRNIGEARTPPLPRRNIREARTPPLPRKDLTETQTPPTARKNKDNPYATYRLSSPLNEVRAEYDVVVVGSGYGGAIAASRCARAGQSVCVFERGKEWWPGDFPETELKSFNELQITMPGRAAPVGKETGLYDMVMGTDVSVLQGCGLGGTSLINANVGLDCDARVFKDPCWPEELREDESSLFGQDRQRVMDMLRPERYPAHFPELPKLKAMELGAAHVIRDIEDLHVPDVFMRPPLYVNFRDTEKNDFGIPQPACNGCGNCVSGCNTGAKNTLNFNYLPDARTFGADIFTEVKVKAVLRDESKAMWAVYYEVLIQDVFHVVEQIVRAKTVILGAGSLGSTNILMNSAERGLQLSSRLGEGFTTNGDALNFCYNTAHKIRSVGIRPSDLKPGHGPGPCISGLIDMRLPDEPLEDGYVLEDGTPPGGWETPLKIVLKTTPGLKMSHGHNTKEALRALTGKANKNTLSVLSMSHDSADGKLVRDKASGRVWADFPHVGCGDNFQKIYDGAKRLTAALEGHHIANPFWKGALSHLRNTKSVITVHPLGGCGMGKSGRQGVVDHAGQVFVGDFDNVHPGLLVVDGAIMPRSLGVNPSLTIAILAERCMRLLAKRNGWHIDYPSRRNIATVYRKTKPGFRFTEKMTGKMEIAGEKVPLSFKVTIESKDIYNMINVDPHHRAGIFGIVTCEKISQKPLTVSDGVFELFAESEEKVETKEMVYKMTLTDPTGEVYQFRGEKCIHKNRMLSIGVTDTTHMAFTLRKGVGEAAEMVGQGKLKLKIRDFLRQLTTIEVTNCHVSSERLRWKTKFCKFFAGALWEVYGVFSPSTTPFDPDAPPRERRDLNLNGADMDIKEIAAGDGVPLILTRYNGGSKGPILLLHGLGVPSRIFSLDTIDKNLVEYLVENGFDVWALDMRFSTALPAHRDKSNVVDAAEFDIPVAIDHILASTQSSKVQIFAHCVGSLAIMCSLLSGFVSKDKIKCIVASQLGFVVKPTSSSSSRPNFLGEGVDAYTDTNDNWMGRVFNVFSDRYASFATTAKEHCDSNVCHRVTFLYRPSWRHGNLNKITHDTLHEWNGFTNKELFKHLSKCSSKKLLCNRDGDTPLIPDWQSKTHLESAKYREAMERLDVPIFFFMGEDNSRWDKQSVKRSCERCQEVNTKQHYECVFVRKYNHTDSIVGKNANTEVFPLFLPFLEKYTTSADAAVQAEA
ncbi:uncharacterized protein [Diadema antillarum]|uniref:uncharacterized protein n=1 Tax=Diadema antillarum TaxID=105358 RepID=UPI003A88198E